jgi:hypothetical protein
MNEPTDDELCDAYERWIAAGVALFGPAATLEMITLVLGPVGDPDRTPAMPPRPLARGLDSALDLHHVEADRPRAQDRPRLQALLELATAELVDLDEPREAATVAQLPMGNHWSHNLTAARPALTAVRSTSISGSGMVYRVWSLTSYFRLMA